MSGIREKLRKELSLLVAGYGNGKQTDIEVGETVGEILAIPEIAEALRLLEESLVKSKKSVVQELPQIDVVTKARLLQADIKQRTLEVRGAE